MNEIETQILPPTLVLGVCGHKGSGKSTIAEILVNRHGFYEQTFAESLKDMVAAVFVWPRDWLDGKTEEHRKWREEIDPFWSKRLDLPLMSPRWTLQNIGTETMRQHFHVDVWVASVEKKLMIQFGKMNEDNTNRRVVLSDCRLNNEKDYITRMGGIILRVHRKSVIKDDNHISEQEFMTFEGPNIVDIDNDGTIEDLHLAAVGALTKIHCQLYLNKIVNRCAKEIIECDAILNWIKEQPK